MQIEVAFIVKGGKILHPSIKRSDFPCQLLMLLPGKIVLKGSKILLLISSVVFIVRHVIVDRRTRTNHLLKLVAHRQIAQEREVAIVRNLAVEHHLHAGHLYARAHQAAHRLRHNASAFDLIREGIANRQIPFGARQQQPYVMTLFGKRDLSARHQLFLFNHTCQRLLDKRRRANLDFRRQTARRRLNVQEVQVHLGTAVGILEAAINLSHRATQTFRHLVFKILGKATGRQIDEHQGRLAHLETVSSVAPTDIPFCSVKARHHALGLLERLLVRRLGALNVPNHQLGNDFSGKVQRQTIKVAMVSHVARRKDGSCLLRAARNTTRPGAHGNESLA